MPYLLQPFSYGDRNPHSLWGIQRRKTAVSVHKSSPTCSVSVAHAEVVSIVSSISDQLNTSLGLQSPQLSVHVQMQPSTRPNEINVIPFPTSESSSRPLPIPPRPHALLRVTPLVPPASSLTHSHAGAISVVPTNKSRVVAPPMQRRRSRDPNVADHLVVEVDDDEHQKSIPPRPSSPTPEAQLHADRGRYPKAISGSECLTSPEQSAPPAYSSLPPPYSASDYEEKRELSGSVGEGKAKEPALVKVPLPSTKCHKPSLSNVAASSSSTSTYKRTRVSTSELKVLVYLYRTVVYGLETRRRKEKESAFEPMQEGSSVSSRTKKPLGPRSSPSLFPPLRAGALIPPPEDKFHFESVLASATKAKSKAKQTHRGFGAFPLIEEDLDDADSDEECEYATPRTPFHSPSQSPKLTPPPLLPSSSFADLVASNGNSHVKPKEKAKADMKAELDVQDALLAIRLKEFLRAQGVCEEDLQIDVHDESDVVVEEVEKVKVDQVHEEEEAEGENILDEYFLGIEEEETCSVKTERGPLVEEDEDVLTKVNSPLIEDELEIDMEDSPAIVSSKPTAPLPHLAITPPMTETQRISSPPPSSPSPRPRAVLPSSYMVALLTMRNRHPSKKPSAGERGKEAKRRSGLRVVVEVD